MAPTHVIVGKGPIGRTLAAHLTALDQDVTVVSASGAPPADHERYPQVSSRQIAAEITDVDTMTRIAAQASAIHCCVNPPYHRWPTAWPPIVDALIETGARTGATIVMAGNLYSYGSRHPQMREDTPEESTEAKGLARARSWAQLRAAHDVGRIAAVEVRGSDYLGPGAGRGAHAGDRMIAPLLAGRTVRMIGAVDQPHTWTFLPDFAAAMAAAATIEASWGQVWHVPSPQALSARELVARFASHAGLPTPRTAVVPVAALRALGVVAPMMRELAAVSSQFTAPFVMDSTHSQDVLGFTPTPWDQIIAQTLAAPRP